MQIERVLNLLQNSGFHVLGSDGTYIWIEDPTCFTRSIIDFINTVAWPVIVVITAFLLLGWAISLIRGAKTDIITNLRNLLLMFGILSLAMTIAGFIYGDDLSAQSCKKIGVPISEVQRILDSRNAKLRRWNADDLWEEFDIYDSAAGNEIPRMEWPDVELPTEYVELPPVDIGGGETITGMVVESRRAARAGVVNNRAVVDTLSVISQSDAIRAREIFRQSSMAIRTVSGAVGDRRRDNRYAGGERGHEGRDLLADAGARVPSFFSARVAAVKPMHHGLMSMTLQNDDGTTTFIGYIKTDLDVNDRVRAGDIIGTVQRLSMAPQYRNTPNHIHYELWTGGKGTGAMMDIADIF